MSYDPPTVRVTFEQAEAPAPPPIARAPWGWTHIPHPNPAVMEIHLLPLSDCGCHAFDLGCQCAPVEDPVAPGFFHHHAFDGREAYESGARKHH